MKELKTNHIKPVTAAVLIMVLLVGGGASWLYFAKLAGAVVAQGVVSVKGKPKTIQHLDGGIVNEILVAEGDSVQQNQVLLRIDGTLLEAKTRIYENRLQEAVAQRSRLIAERDDLKQIRWDDEVLRLLDVEVQDGPRRGQEKLFAVRRETLNAQISQHKEKIKQFKNEILGIKATDRSNHSQLLLFEEELQGVRSLKEEGLASNTKLMNLERQREALIGKQGEFKSDIARLKNSINEVEIQILRTRTEFIQSVLSDIRNIDKEINSVSQQLYATLDQLERVDIVSPTTGIVHQMNVTTVGGVVTPSEPILQIVPQNGTLEIETNVEPQFIDSLFMGQLATLRFTAYNQKDTPEVEGVLSNISPNSIINEQTGIAYYKVTIAIDKSNVNEILPSDLMPGMPVEAFIRTGNRSPLSYLLKPLTDQMSHALRES